MRAIGDVEGELECKRRWERVSSTTTTTNEGNHSMSERMSRVEPRNERS